MGYCKTLCREYSGNWFQRATDGTTKNCLPSVTGEILKEIGKVELLISSNTVDGIVIKNNEDGSGPSTDGIDVDSSEWVLVENCAMQNTSDKLYMTKEHRSM